MANAFYSELRQLMRKNDVRNSDIARWINRSEVYVSQRLNGAPWMQDEMYTIADKLYVSRRKLHLLFPPKGMWAGPLEDPPPTTDEELCHVFRKMIKEVAK